MDVDTFAPFSGSAEPTPATPAEAKAESLLARLKRETRALQIEVEASFPILSTPITDRRYRGACAALWGFHAPLERRLRAVAGLDRIVTDLEQRYKTHLLRCDLVELALSSPETELAECCELPALSDVSRALGALYVLEVSTLGGRHVERYLSHVLPSTMARASRFLNGYGADTEARWAAFGAQLEAASDIDEEAVLAGAIDTLCAAKAWFSQTFCADTHSDFDFSLSLSLTDGYRHPEPSPRLAWGAEVERMLLRAWPGLGLALPAWSGLGRAIARWTPPFLLTPVRRQDPRSPSQSGSDRAA